MSLLAILTVVLCALTLSFAAPENSTRVDDLDMKGLIKKSRPTKSISKHITIINKSLKFASFIHMLVIACLCLKIAYNYFYMYLYFRSPVHTLPLRNGIYIWCI